MELLLKNDFLRGFLALNLQLFSGVAFLFSTPLVAQDLDDRGVSLGVFQLNSSLLLEYSEDDNLYRSEEAPLSTSIYSITPTIELSFDDGISGFNLAYFAEDASFSERESEDYTDHNLAVGLGTTFAGIHRIEARYQYLDGHDRRDLDSPTGIEFDLNGLPANNPGNLDRYENGEYGFSYVIGSEDSLLILRLNADEFNREYKTNLDQGAGDFDREESSIGAILNWNVFPNLTFNLSYVDTTIDYVNLKLSPLRDRSGDEQITSTGFAWSPYDTLTLEANIGVTDRYTVATGDVSNDYWDISAEWNIYSYSTLRLVSSSYVDEDTSGDGAFTLREEAGFNWTHEWTDLLSTELNFLDRSIEYTGTSRTDNSELIYFQIGYDFRRWFNVSLFAENATRSSSSTDDYDQQIFGVRALFQL